MLTCLLIINDNALILLLKRRGLCRARDPWNDWLAIELKGLKSNQSAVAESRVHSCLELRPTTMAVTHSVISAAEQFVRRELAGMDASHDYQHIHRVRANARRLAELEGLGADAVMLVDLSALLHDVRDWKYSGNDGATSEAVDVSGRAFLAALLCTISAMSGTCMHAWCGCRLHPQHTLLATFIMCATHTRTHNHPPANGMRHATY